MQQFMVVGMIGSNVQFSDTGSVAYARMSVADNTYYRDAVTGEKRQFTSWIPVVAFGSKAEFMRQYLKKGMMIGLTGEWRNRIFEKDGEKRYSMELRLGQVMFCDTKGKQAAEESDDPNGDEEFMSIPVSPFADGFELPSYIPEDGE